MCSRRLNRVWQDRAKRAPIRSVTTNKNTNLQKHRGESPMYNECRHIFTSGKKCQSPALKDQSFCYFHSNTRKRPAPKDEAYEPYIAPHDTAHTLPPLEDADAIQLALYDVVLALAANSIDARRARILIYGLQVASQNYRNRSLMAAKEATPVQTVSETQEHEDG